MLQDLNDTSKGISEVIFSGQEYSKRLKGFEPLREPLMRSIAAGKVKSQELLLLWTDVFRKEPISFDGHNYNSKATALREQLLTKPGSMTVADVEDITEMAKWCKDTIASHEQGHAKLDKILALVRTEDIPEITLDVTPYTFTGEGITEFDRGPKAESLREVKHGTYSLPERQRQDGWSAELKLRAKKIVAYLRQVDQDNKNWSEARYAQLVPKGMPAIWRARIHEQLSDEMKVVESRTYNPADDAGSRVFVPFKTLVIDANLNVTLKTQKQAGPRQP